MYGGINTNAQFRPIDKLWLKEIVNIKLNNLKG